jgi:hypothetical protein
MGYSTEFKGELKFKKELTASQLGKVSSFLGEDCRDHDWLASKGLYYVDLELLPDFSGLKWSETEKTYGMVDLINMIIVNMSEDYPDFGFTGKMLAQGEDIDDRWELLIGDDGRAYRKDVVISGTKIMCPHCEQDFYIE